MRYLVCTAFLLIPVALCDMGIGQPLLRRNLQQTTTTTLKLLQASTGTLIATIQNDATISVAEITDLTVVASVDAGDTSYVKFALRTNTPNTSTNTNNDGNSQYHKYEGRAPYALCGKEAKTGVYYACDQLFDGWDQDYTLSVTLSNGKTKTLSFRLVNERDEPTTTSEAITFEYDLIDTTSSPQIILHSNLPNNAKINKSKYGIQDDSMQLTVSVRPSSNTVGTLKFDNGVVEARLPYSYCGDTAGVFNDCFSASISQHTFSFNLISKQGKLIARESFSFSLVDSTASTTDDPDDKPIGPSDETSSNEDERAGIVPAGQWKLTSNLDITERHEACFVWVDGKAYLIGGRRGPPTDIYDTKSNTWSQGSPPPADLHHLQCVVVNETQIWIVVAWTGTFPRETSAKDIFIYDTITDVWSTKPGLPEDRRRGSAAVVLAGNRIYVSHGSQGGHATTEHSAVLSTGFIDYYDLKKHVWVTNLPDAPHPRDHTGGAYLHNRYICVAGGRDGSIVGWPAVLPTDCFDTVTRTWTTQADIPNPRSGSSYGTSCNGEWLLLAGGEMGDNVFDDVYAFNGEEWTTLPSLQIARHGSSLAVDCTCNRILLASGSGGARGGPELSSMEVLGGDGC